MSEGVKWIKCENQKPKDDQLVVAWLFKSKFPVTALYKKDHFGYIWQEFRDFDCYEQDRVSHWFPIDEVPYE